MSDPGLKRKFVVSIDQKKCIGCGSCESIAELIFKLNDKGVAEVR